MMKTFTLVAVAALGLGLAGCKVQTGDVNNGGGKKEEPAATQTVAPDAPAESTTAK
jgi:hypothetical protein